MTRIEAMETAAKWAAAGVVLIGPRVGVLRDEAADKTKGGIVIPDTAKSKPIRGRVVFIGLGCDPTDHSDPVCGLALGDHVTFTKYNPTLFEFEVGGESQQVEIMHATDLYLAWKD